MIQEKFKLKSTYKPAGSQPEAIKKLVEGFTKKYNITQLVHYEKFDNIENAIEREKQLKKWNRKWKLDLIEKENPNWNDLYNLI